MVTEQSHQQSIAPNQGPVHPSPPAPIAGHVPIQPPYTPSGQTHVPTQTLAQPGKYVDAQNVYGVSPMYYQQRMQGPIGPSQPVYGGQPSIGEAMYQQVPPKGSIAQPPIINPQGVVPGFNGTASYPQNSDFNGDQSQFQPTMLQSDQNPLHSNDKKRKRASGSLSSRITNVYPRKRALTACDVCRLKKIKCDNVRPQCGSCAKNGNANCHYRTDDLQKDYSSYDPASLNILSKLDLIIREVQDIKKDQPSTESVSPNTSYYHSTSERTEIERPDKNNCTWHMSVTSLLKWRYLNKVLELSDQFTDDVIRRLIKSYDNEPSSNIMSLSKAVETNVILEKFLSMNFSNLVTSYLTNCHYKTPVVDMVELLEVIEIHEVITSFDSEITLMSLMEQYQNTDTELPDIYYQALKCRGLKDVEYRRNAFSLLCTSIPFLIMICALGLISTPILLDNISSYSNSLEERDSLKIGPVQPSSVPEGLPQSRYALSILLINYAKFITSFFPITSKENALYTIVYHILLSQFSLHTMSPLKAYRGIVDAGNQMTYFLETKRSPSDCFKIEFGSEYKRIKIERVFWTCLKLECELRAELSPYVSPSGIDTIVPPSSFPKVLESSFEGEPEIDDEKRSRTCVKLAAKYDDKYTWYYFLTEIAVRKVDNKMFDEIYSYSGNKNTWDEPKFADDEVWKTFIKYLDQYNGIVNSLTPKVRNFVLSEVNVEQIYKSMKSKRLKKKSDKDELYSSDDFDNLESYLIDEDVLLRAQSESIMFIKTRLISSKVVLFRPIVYLILEDKISFQELLLAMTSVMTDIHRESTSHLLDDTSSSSESHSGFTQSNISSDIHLDLDYFKIDQAPPIYQQKNPNEDFTDLVEDAGAEIKLRDVGSVKNRILKVFFQNLISLPKSNVPSLGTHRHPGSWYYLRNLYIGTMYLYLLYKKFEEMMASAAMDEGFKQMLASSGSASSLEDIAESLNTIISRESVKINLLHTQDVFDYWKDESKDCQVYYDYIKMFLEHL